METSVDAALGRIALILRLIGAGWMAVLVAVNAAVGALQSPAATAAVAAGGAAWAVVAWRGGWIDRGRGDRRAVLAVDLAASSAVVLVPALLGEDASVAGGYPFAALLVGLSAGGRRGVVVSAVVLGAVTLASVAVVGTGGLPFVVGNLLFYALAAAALAVGLEVIRRAERRVVEAQAAQAVAEERASLASHLHDSVLQTLALVQRRAEDPAAVRALARRQERELREWLFPAPAAAPHDPDRRMRGSPGESRGDPRMRGGGDRRLGPALERHAEEVEADHGVAIAVLVRGRAAAQPLDGDDRAGLDALVLAAREAMANAAVHAGVAGIDVFAEADDDGVRVYVRDRGRGFDPDAIPDDRQGVRGSILGRVRRAGGTAVVRSQPGRGTEWELRMPHSAT